MQYGHFDNEKREYVIDRVDLPASWTNYLGVGNLCAVVNHTAGGYLFYQSPEYHRITRFRGNAVPADRPGHYVYLRDAEDGDYWSISWQPVGKPLELAEYRCRHGMSYSVYECSYKGIEASQKLSVAMEDPVELWDVKLKNTTDRQRRISVFSYLEFSFHHVMIDNQNFQMSLYCAGSSYEDGIIEHDLFYEEFGYQYFTGSFQPDGYDCLRDKFLGAYRTEDNPIAVERGRCGSSRELGNNHCGSLQKDLVLAPGEEARLIFMLGEGNRTEGRKIREKYRDVSNVEQSYKQLGAYWEEKFGRLQIQTPQRGNEYHDQHLESLSGRGEYHVFPVCILCGGGRKNRPWLPGYRSGRHDHSPFQSGQVGSSGICKGLRADWNDCLNLGGGESAMVSFLHHWALGHFIDLAGYLGRSADAEQYAGMQKKVRNTCNDKLWDREWFIRGITKDGRKIGTFQDQEGRIHLESNAWAVLSQAAEEEKGRQAMDSVNRHLFTPYGIMLNAPSYTVPDDEIGFVTRVYPGVKENGSIFSHPNPWAWAAECILGRGSRAMKYYNSICPCLQNDKIEIRESEPYSYCQFIMGKDHTALGRARHPFMTGSGGWAYYAATRYMLGVRPGFKELVIDPCIPASWKEFSLVRRWRGAEYRICVKNPESIEKGVRELRLDGKVTDHIPVLEPGTVHTVEVTMGKQ